MIPVARPCLGNQEQQAAAEAIASGWVTQGPRVEAFEKAFAAYVGALHAVAVSNCTAALHIALLAAGVGEGDEVICPSLSFIATANAVRHCGARPVFADVRIDDFNLDPQAVEGAITPRTKAILPVDQLGMPADMEAIGAIARRRGIAVVEDAACAAGSEYRGRKVGRPLGHLVCFSFHPRKVITTGEGGMVTTDDAPAAERLRLLRHHGMSVSDLARHQARRVVMEQYVCVGYNYRMTDIQAAVGIEQLKKLDDLVARRRELAGRFSRELSGLTGVRVPVERQGARSNFQSYAIVLAEQARMARDDLMQALLDRGIATRRGVMAIHRQPAYADLPPAGPLPVTEYLTDRSLVLPMYAQMTAAEQDQVIAQVKALLG